MNAALQRLVEAVLGLHADGQPSVSGRVLDPIGKPVEDAVVSARQLTGEPLIDARVGAGGRFLIVSNAAWPDEYELVVEVRGAELRLLRSRPPPVVAPVPPVADDVGDLTIRAPIVLTGSIGDGGQNARIDLRRVQERLHDLGRLTDADIQAEPLVPDPPPEALNIENFPRLLAAVFAHNQAWLGHRQGVIQPGSASLRALNADPAFPIARIAVTRPVGSLPGVEPPVAMNAPMDVRAVQDRLHQLGLLTEGRYLIERVDPATAADPVATILTSTVEAIARFEREVVGGALKAVPPGRITEQVLSDPYVWGRLPLQLSAAVGAGAPNRPADVRAVQERLHDLGALNDAAYGAERVVPGPGDPAGPVPEADLPETLNAIRAFRENPQRLGEGAPAPARVDLDDPAVVRLDSPPRVDFHELRENATAAEPNRPDDTRAIQDRLLLLGFLSAADHQAERVNPARTTGVPANEVPRTMAAARELLVSLGIIAAPSGPFVLRPTDRPPRLVTLTDPVGPGQPNRPADVRAVQDRLRELRFLPEADYQREHVDPAAAASPPDSALSGTFAAVSTLRRQVLGHPPVVAGDAWTAEPVVRPGDATHAALALPLRFGRYQLRLSASVGTGGWNRPPDVRAVQERLHDLRLLDDPSYQAELVDPARLGRIPDGQLGLTIGAISVLREQFLGLAGPALGRLEPAHPVLRALANPLYGLKTSIDLGDSVGWMGVNEVADVRRVLRRLRDLRFLAHDHADAEEVRVGALVGANVPAADIPRTIDAIEAWRAACGIANRATPIEPDDASHRRLVWLLVPPPTALALTQPVGDTAAAGANVTAEVRRLLDRLHELGYVTTADLLAERPAMVGANVPRASIPRTIAGLRATQATAAGNPTAAPDGIVSPRGITHRVLDDPSHGTVSRINPHCDLRAAGPATPAFPHQVLLIIGAIETHEGGVSTGEVPALLINASGTPASFGKAQNIGETAVTTMQNDAAVRWDYFTVPELNTLSQVAAPQGLVQRVNGWWNGVRINLVAHPAATDAALLVVAAHFAAANLAAFRAETGLTEDDMVRMFRAQQFITHFTPHVIAGGTPAQRDNAIAAAAPAGSAAAANVAALGFRTNDLRTYIVNPGPNVEHRAGFVTRALFTSALGQRLRNAMTDDSGFKLGRATIQQNYNAVTNAPGGAALTDAQRAQATAYVHNHGAGSFGNVAGVVADVAANPAPRHPIPPAGLFVVEDEYVRNVMAHWAGP